MIHMFSMREPQHGGSIGVQSTSTIDKVFSLNPSLTFCVVSWAHIGRSFKQYLAVAPFPTSSHMPHIGVRAPRPSNACIQIWSFGASMTSSKGSSKKRPEDHGQMRCEMVVCHDSGPAHELKWCPLPSDDSVSISVFAT